MMRQKIAYCISNVHSTFDKQTHRSPSWVSSSKLSSRAGQAAACEGGTSGSFGHMAGGNGWMLMLSMMTAAVCNGSKAHWACGHLY